MPQPKTNYLHIIIAISSLPCRKHQLSLVLDLIWTWYRAGTDVYSTDVNIKNKNNYLNMIAYGKYY